MRKGQELENHINSIITSINALGWHGHKNNPLRTLQGVTIKGEPFDFEIFTPECVHLFDAKECSNSHLKWSLYSFCGSGRDSKRLNSQLSILNKLNHLDYCSGYFLVWFKKSSNPLHLVCFSPDVILDTIAAARFFLSPTDGYSWPFPYNPFFYSKELIS